MFACLISLQNAENRVECCGFNGRLFSVTTPLPIYKLTGQIFKDDIEIQELLGAGGIGYNTGIRAVGLRGLKDMFCCNRKRRAIAVYSLAMVGTILFALDAQADMVSADKLPDSVTETPVKDKWALVIGISRFQNPGYNLRFAAKDAEDFANFAMDKLC